ncbi:MAG: hypothetical protein ABI051_17715 [Vicinamibacterales bacterium]
MKRLFVAAFLTIPVVPGVVWAQAPTAPRVLQLTFDADGSVNLEAQNVTVREILAEWARQCGCYIVNAQSLQGGPLTIPVAFPHAPQGKVLESLLRQAAGYTLTPRRAGSPSLSQYETIYIVATSAPSQTAYTPPAPQQPTTTQGSPEDEIPPIVPTILRREPIALPLPAAVPQAPGQQQAPGQPTPGQPQTQPPAPAARTPGVFVPIVPAGPQPQGAAPGSVSSPRQPAQTGGR